MGFLITPPPLTNFKNKEANIFLVQENNSIMCRYFCIGFIAFMLADKKLTDYTNLFSPHDFKKQ